MKNSRIPALGDRNAERLVADAVGYSHLIEANQAGTLRKRCKPTSEDGPTPK
jgi:hypothetical protein